MSTTTSARIAGALYLLGFVVYIAGYALINAGTGGASISLTAAADHPTLISTGALLMLANSACAVAIAVLLFPILRRHSDRAAHAFLVEGPITAVILTVGVILLLFLVPLGQEYAAAGAGSGSALDSLARVSADGNHYAYLVAMTTHAIGGLVLCRVLLKAGLVPGFLAVWGIVGYAIHGTGTVLEILTDAHPLGVPVSDVLSVPGGLFEVVLGVLLIAKGVSSRQHHDTAAHTPTVTSEPVLA
jgi:Domain of unknown function (DUF4386)